MNILRQLFKTKKNSRPLRRYRIPKGGDVTEVYGDQYRGKEIRRMYRDIKKSEFTVSITPPAQYQIDKGWPSLPFVNVNTEGSLATTYDNWLGYIPYGYGHLIDFDKLLADYDYIEATARIEKHGRDYEVVIIEPESMRVGVKHADEKHRKVLDIAFDRGMKKIDVDLVWEESTDSRNRKVKRYRVEFKGYTVGEISAPKSKALKEFIGGKKYSARMNLRYHDENNRHYTNMDIMVY